MDHQTVQVQTLWPLAVYVVAVIVLAVTTIGFSYVLGERHMGRSTGEEKPSSET